ncbi:hypothetical protein ACWD4J_10720 [Streptomyces sp. NPDC002577]
MSTLSEQQVRGKACVWCAVALDNGTAVDLGPRAMKVVDDQARWFPRSCSSCAEPHAYRALLDHSQRCEQCADDQSQCQEGTALRSTVKEAR